MVPFALEATLSALTSKVVGTALPGVPTPALGLPYPSLKQDSQVSKPNKTLIIYGGSSSVGSMATQIATAAGIRVISILGSRNFGLATDCGAVHTISRDDPALVDKAVEAARKFPQNEFVGIFDTISSPATYEHDVKILKELDGGGFICVHPPPVIADVPAKTNIKPAMIFAGREETSVVWEGFVTPALACGQLKCLPQPHVVGKGLQHVQEALELMKAGVSATKLVVEL